MIRHIVAIDNKRGIAKAGSQPWKLPTDEAYFSKLTKAFGGVVLMGRKTFEVIGSPLTGRQNFVASRQAVEAEGVTAVNDIEQFLKHYDGDVWVIGGASLYELTLPFADELYVTEIDADFACDQFYPAVPGDFALSSDSGNQTENDLKYSFKIYAKTTK